MPESKISANRSNTTKWPRFVTSLKLSNLLCALLFLTLVKIGALAVFGVETGRFFKHSAAKNIAAVALDTAADAQTPPPAAAPAPPAPGKAPAAPTAAAPAAAPAASAQGKAPATPSAQGQGKAPPAPAQAAAPGGSAQEQPLNWEMLKQKQDELSAREAALKTLENDLNARQQQLAALESQVKKLIDQANSIKDEKIKHLVGVYVNMKAKQAAQVLETLDEDISVKILAGMSGRQAGEILSSVNAKKAARLTEDLTKFQTRPGQ